MKRYGLREKAGADPQTYALGLKEVWQVLPLFKHSGQAVTACPCTAHCGLAPSQMAATWPQREQVAYAVACKSQQAWLHHGEIAPQKIMSPGYEQTHLLNHDL